MSHIPIAAPGPTYARARLWLGITGVGSTVLLALATLVLDLPARLPAGPATTGLLEGALRATGNALTALLLPTLLLLPLDWLGGARIVRDRPGTGRWLLGWLGGVSAQFLVWGVAGTTLALAARVGGAPAALGAFVLLELLLVLLRGPVARLAVSMPLRAPDALDARRLPKSLEGARVRVVDAPDEGFTGGWTGLTGRTLWLAAHHLGLPDAALRALLVRRVATRASGAHWRGVLGAIAWNTLGVAVVLWGLRPDVRTAAGLVTLAAGMTLWGFLGVLLLPTPSRAAVYQLDEEVARRVGFDAARDAIELLDRWQDDEPARSRLVESIFHPVPARAARIHRLVAGPGASGPAAHQLARHALFLSWAALSPLARAVHCNIGRPALWVFLPSD